MNKKLVIFSSIITSILMLSIFTVQAADNYYPIASYSYDIPVSYDALSDMCAMVNKDIADGRFATPLGNTHKGWWAYMYHYTGGWCIMVKGPGTNDLYLGNTNGGRYIALDSERDDLIILGLIQDYVTAVNNKCSSIVDKLDSISNNVSNLLSSVRGINSLTTSISTRCDNIDTHVTGILSRLQSISGQIADIDEVNYKAVGYMTYSSGNLIPQRKIDYSSAQAICSWFNTWHQTDAIEVFNRDDTTTQSNPIVNLTATLQDVSISGTTYHIIRIVGYTSAGNVYNYYLCDQTKNIITYDLVPNGSGGGSNDYSAYLTAISNTLSNMFDLTADIEVEIQDHDYTDFLNPIVDGTRRNIGEAAFYSEIILEEFRHNMRYSWNNQFAQLPNIANRLIVTVDNVEHTAAESLYYGYLRLISIDNKLSNLTIPNYSSVLTQINGRLARDVDGVTYTVADSTYHTMVAARGILNKQDAIIEAINSIQDWLDNADLATNATITSMIQEEQNYLNDISPSGKRVKNLFKRAYDFTDDNYSILDWANVMAYFSNPWNDSPWEVG